MARGRHAGPDFQSHVRDAEVEDVQFLIDTGSTMEAACARVGVHPEALAGRLRPDRGRNR